MKFIITILWNRNHMQIRGQILKVLKGLRISPSRHDWLSRTRLPLQSHANTQLGPKRGTAVRSPRLGLLRGDSTEHRPIVATSAPQMESRGFPSLYKREQCPKEYKRVHTYVTSHISSFWAQMTCIALIKCIPEIHSLCLIPSLSLQQLPTSLYICLFMYVIYTCPHAHK